jgi:xanthine dehydrogenase YagS FAD-binding subunit
MKDFRLAEPASLAQAAGFLADPENRALPAAGGTDLLGLLKEGIVEPGAVVDLAVIPGLAYIEADARALHLGALTPVADVAADKSVPEFAVLREAASVIASPQLRHMGTVGGNLCQRPRCWYFRDILSVCRKKGGSVCFAVNGRNRYHAILGASVCHIVYPSDLAPALISLGASAVIVSPAGERTVPLEEFYTLPSVDVRKENILQPGELLREVTVPLPRPGLKSAYLKFMERGAFDFAVVSAAAAANLSGRTVKDIRVVMGGVGTIPWRLEATERRLRGAALAEPAVAAAVAEGLADARPMSENGYKVELAKAIATRAVLSLVAG